jgi:hypothetical protein
MVYFLLGISPFPCARILKAGVSEHSVASIFTRVKMDPTDCSETSAFNIQIQGKYPEENTPCDSVSVGEKSHRICINTGKKRGYFFSDLSNTRISSVGANKQITF